MLLFSVQHCNYAAFLTGRCGAFNYIDLSLVCCNCGTLHADRVKDFLVSIKVTWTHSSTDTPQQNSISERNFRTMAERTLAMLLQSGLPKSMWWKAYTAARYVTLRLLTKTCQRYVSPMECVPGGAVPTHKWFRV